MCVWEFVFICVHPWLVFYLARRSRTVFGGVKGGNHYHHIDSLTLGFLLTPRASIAVLQSPASLNRFSNDGAFGQRLDEDFAVGFCGDSGVKDNDLSGVGFTTD